MGAALVGCHICNDIVHGPYFGLGQIVQGMTAGGRRQLKDKKIQGDSLNREIIMRSMKYPPPPLTDPTSEKVA